eukprot:jgi/Botrbrau1/1795/Bobra.0217s0047.1
MAFPYGATAGAYLPGANSAQIASSQMQAHLEQQAKLKQQLEEFWLNALEEVQKIGPGSTEFKTQQLPLTRIKKIMKSDEAVRMISAEAPLLLSKASEIFIHELSLRAWSHAELNKRRTLQKNDIESAVQSHDAFDFLVDIIGYPTAAAEQAGVALHPVLPGLTYALPSGGGPIPFEAPVLGVPTALDPLAPVPALMGSEPPGVGSTGEVNEDGQTTFG